MFDDKFLDSLPKDPISALNKLCITFVEDDTMIPPKDKINYYDDYINAYAVIDTFIEAHDINIDYDFNISTADMAQSKEVAIGLIIEFVRYLKLHVEPLLVKSDVEKAFDKYRSRFGLIFTYNFTDGDLKRIQEVINELRTLLSKSELFDANHKERLLNKLENLQRELHKQVSSLDKCWGLIGDAGVVLGKFGKDAKPFVDRVKEIAQITWRTQARAEELPSGLSIPFLSTEKDED